MFVTNRFLLLIPLLFSLLFKQKEQQQYIIRGYAQGTDYTIKYFYADSIISKENIDSLLLEIDISMSLYKPHSLISKFNASKSGLKIDRHFKTVLEKSFEINKATSGKFDVTVAPLVQAWGFGPKPVAGFPDSLEIRALLKFVGMKNLRLMGNRLGKVKPGVQVDLNGIAQGYSVDVVAAYLLRRGIKIFVVEIGGEIRMKGPKPDGSSLRIGIEGPASSPNAEPVMKHILCIDSGAVTTSGNYRKYLQMGRKRIMHLIDPVTGYPLENEMISVTVYAKDAITADGYDNALMSMTVKEALAFVSSRNDIDAYIIYRKEGMIADTLSSGFKKMIAN